MEDEHGDATCEHLLFKLVLLLLLLLLILLLILLLLLLLLLLFVILLLVLFQTQNPKPEIQKKTTLCTKFGVEGLQPPIEHRASRAPPPQQGTGFRV